MNASPPSTGPFIDRVLAWAAALVFYVWWMLLPLVGRSGAAAPHARANGVTSWVILLLSFSLTILAARRRIAGTEKVSAWLRGLCAAQALCVLLLLAGAFKR